jgi:hypothetical protein
MRVAALPKQIEQSVKLRVTAVGPDQFGANQRVEATPQPARNPV